MFQKPTQKTIINAGITTMSFIAGAKIGDGIAAVMPESTAPYKRIGLGVAGILLAASINAKTPASQAAQSALLGMGAKQLCEEITDQLTTAVAKQGTPIDGDASGKLESTTVQKFINGVVGHANPAGLGFSYLSAAWDSGTASENIWDRPILLDQPTEVSFNPDLLV